MSFERAVEPGRDFNATLDSLLRLTIEQIGQRDFFTRAFLESKEMEFPGRQVKGPYYNDFNVLLEQIHKELLQIRPDLTPEFLMPSNYQSVRVHKQIEEMPSNVNEQLLTLSQSRLNLLAQLADEVTVPILSAQTIKPGTFDTPPYCYQGDGLDNNAWRGCFNSCFRMVYGGIFGDIPHERALNQAIAHNYGDVSLHDEEYLGLFYTKIVQDMYNKNIATVSIEGADLTMLEQIAAKLKASNAKRKVYCISNIGSKSYDKSIWHAVVIMNASNDYVMVQDPSRNYGGENKLYDKAEFIKNWAITFNRAHLIISQ